MNTKQFFLLSAITLLFINFQYQQVHAEGKGRNPLEKDDFSVYSCMQNKDQLLTNQVKVDNGTTALIQFTFIFQNQPFSIVLSPDIFQNNFIHNQLDSIEHGSRVTMSVGYGIYKILAKKKDGSEVFEMKFRGPMVDEEADITPYYKGEFELDGVSIEKAQEVNSPAIYLMQDFEIEKAKEMLAEKIIKDNPVPGFFVETIERQVEIPATPMDIVEKNKGEARKSLNKFLKECPNINDKVFRSWVQYLKTLGVSVEGTTYY